MLQTSPFLNQRHHIYDLVIAASGNPFASVLHPADIFKLKKIAYITVAEIDCLSSMGRTILLVLSSSQQIFFCLIQDANNPSPTIRLINPEFEQVIKYVKNRSSLLKQLDTLKKRTLRIQMLVDEFKKDNPNWEGDFFKLRQFPYFALQALREQRIMAQQFGTIMLVWSILRRHGTESFTVERYYERSDSEKFDIRPVGFRYKKRKWYDLIELTGKSIFNQLCLFTGKNYEKFHKRVVQLPSSERQFFCIMDTDFNKPKNSLGQHIYFDLRMQIFSFFQAMMPMRVIASVGIMQAYLDTVFDNSLQIEVILNLSTPQGIYESAMRGARPMTVPFPGMCFKKIHNYPAPYYDVTHHDFTHLIAHSAFTLFEREVICQIYRFIKEFIIKEDRENLSLEWKEERKKILNLMEKVIDFDYYFLSGSQAEAEIYNTLPKIRWRWIVTFLYILNFNGENPDVVLEREFNFLKVSQCLQNFTRQMLEYLMQHYPSFVEISTLNEIIQEIEKRGNIESIVLVAERLSVKKTPSGPFKTIANISLSYKKCYRVIRFPVKPTYLEKYNLLKYILNLCVTLKR